MNFDWRRTPNIFPWLFPEITWKINTHKKELFLTFDDGPSPQITTYVLRELKKRNIKATFFCQGQNLRDFSEEAEQIIKDCHTIANHTYRHQNGWKTSKREYLKSVEECQDMISIYNQNPKKVFRPPYGKISFSQYVAIIKHYQVVMWSLMIADFDDRINRESCLKLALEKTRNGDIIVFHDNEQSAEKLNYVLPRYLDYCLDNGYEFGLISECQSS